MENDRTILAPHFNRDDGKVLGAFSRERYAISEKLFALLVPVMNEVHGLSFSHRFWKIVLNAHVNAVISIKHVLSDKKLDDSPLLLPINSHHLPTSKQRLIARLPSLVKHFKAPLNLRKIHEVLGAGDNFNIDFPEIEAVREDTGLPLPLYYSIYPGRGNQVLREKVNSIAARQADVYLYNVIRRLPKLYVEYFSRDYDSIRLINPTAKRFHVHGLPPYFSSLLVAKYIEHGSKLYCYQHGAYYGELVGHNSYLTENSLADEFRTWGWKIKSNDVPWKAYRLEDFRLKYEKYSRTRQYDFLMCYPDVNASTIGFYKGGTDYFLKNISRTKYKNLLARPRPMHKMFSHADRISFIKDQRVTIDSGMDPMAEVVSKCRLVVQFTIPATNFMECLYVDHPTMGLLDNDQPTEQIKPYYDYLIEQGVIHRDFVSLVNHLNSIDVDVWWNRLIKEPRYLEFKNTFLRKA